MSLDVAIQTFNAQKEGIPWRPLKGVAQLTTSFGKTSFVKVWHYHAEDGVYVFRFGAAGNKYAFMKGRSPMDAYKRLVMENGKAKEAS